MQDLQSAELSNFLQEPCTPQNIQAIDRQVNKPGSSTASLYTIILGDRIEVIAKFPGQSLFHYSSTIPESEVRQKIGAFQELLPKYDRINQMKSQGMEIYQWLIKPIEEKLEHFQIKTIVFTLDGPLRNIPMATLYDGNKYLIEKYAVAVTLDLGIQDPKPLRNDRLSVLAAALVNPPAQLSQQFNALPFASKEIESIKSIRGIKAKTLEDEKFTLEALRKELSNFSYTVVHLATHGEFNSNPEDTFILTAPSHLPNHEMSDGKVRLRDIDKLFRTINLNRTNTLELLVLSACQTARGDEQASLGIAGVVVRSGTSSVIASLWSIDDESTQKLMAVFYNKIVQPGVSRAEALRQAQLALIQAKNDNTYIHPYYWGAFLLLGNWL
jgi:CHAT domain-containing protein